MNQSGSKGPKANGWLAAVYAGLPLGAAVVTALDVTGNERLTMVGAAVVSLLVAWGGARMEASKNRKYSGGYGMAAQQKPTYSKLTLFLVAVAITCGVGVKLYLKVAWPPEAVVILTVVAVVGIAVAAFLGRKSRQSKKSKKSKNNSGNWGSWGY